MFRDEMRTGIWGTEEREGNKEKEKKKKGKRKKEEKGEKCKNTNSDDVMV